MTPVIEQKSSSMASSTSPRQGMPQQCGNQQDPYSDVRNLFNHMQALMLNFEDKLQTQANSQGTNSQFAIRPLGSGSSAFSQTNSAAVGVGNGGVATTSGEGHKGQGTNGVCDINNFVSDNSQVL